MTDTLGQSQVLPYLIGIQQQTHYQHRITLISCEKTERFASHEAHIRQLTEQHHIHWQPLSFSTRPPVLAKYYDRYRMYRLARQLHRSTPFEWAHCRSYVAAMVGKKLKATCGIKMLFDMRGFWVDERVEGGLWKLDKPFYRIAYKHYKQVEGQLIAAADHIVVLTEKARSEIQTWAAWQHTPAPISVIPCAADFEHFTIASAQQRVEARQQLGIEPHALVLTYLGSIGTWYLTDSLLDFFVQVQQQFQHAVLLIISPNKPHEIQPYLQAHQLHEQQVRTVSASRQQVPQYMAATDLSVFFIKNSYSKKATSPVKLGESLAMGIPVITNAGIGDVDAIVQQNDAGYLISNCTAHEYGKAIQQIPQLLQKDSSEIRQKAQPYYALTAGVVAYLSIYGHKSNNTVAK